MSPLGICFTFTALYLRILLAFWDSLEGRLKLKQIHSVFYFDLPKDVFGWKFQIVRKGRKNINCTMGVPFVQKGVDKNCPAIPSFCFQHTANGSFLFSGAAQALKMGNKGLRWVTADSQARVVAYFSPNVLRLLFTSGCCKMFWEKKLLELSVLGKSYY